MSLLATPCCNTVWRALIGINDESANMITAKCKVHPTYVCKSMSSIWSGLFLLLPVFLGRVQPETAVLKLGKLKPEEKLAATHFRVGYCRSVQCGQGPDISIGIVFGGLLCSPVSC